MMSKAATVIDTENRILVAIGLGEGKWGGVFNGHRVSVLQNQKHSGAWLYSNVNILNVTELHTQKWLNNTFYVVHFPTLFFKKVTIYTHQKK